MDGIYVMGSIRWMVEHKFTGVWAKIVDYMMISDTNFTQLLLRYIEKGFSFCTRAIKLNAHGIAYNINKFRLAFTSDQREGEYSEIGVPCPHHVSQTKKHTHTHSHIILSLFFPTAKKKNIRTHNLNMQISQKLRMR